MGKKARRILFIALVICFVVPLGTSLAEKYGEDRQGPMTLPNVQISYGDNAAFAVKCDADGFQFQYGKNCPSPSELKYSVCGGEFSSVSTGRYEPGVVNYFALMYPGPWEKQPCSYGWEKNDYLTIKDTRTGRTWTGGQLRFYPRTAGPNLRVVMNTAGDLYKTAGSEAGLHDFKLMDNTNKHPAGTVVMGEIDAAWNANEWGSMEANMNTVLNSASGKLNPFLSFDYPSSCPGSLPDPGYPLSSQNENDFCLIAHTGFTTDWDTVSAEKCNGNCGLGYDPSFRMDYSPVGEIVMGQGYGFNDRAGGPPSSVQSKIFFMCHDKLDDTHGVAVYSPGDNYKYDQFRCTSSGEWKNVPLCDDGVDNDDDGVTDMDDPECISTSRDNSESIRETECPLRIYQGDKIESYYQPEDRVAFYAPGEGSYSPEGENCQYKKESFPDYSSTDSLFPDGEPFVFKCLKQANRGGTLSSYDGDFYTNKYYNASSYCNVIKNNWPFGHEDSVPVVEYYVKEKNIPTGSGEEVARFFGEGGFKNYFFQSLHEAESKYFQIVPLPTGCTRYPCYSYVHHKESYQPLNMTELEDGYNPDQEVLSGSRFIEDARQSWVISNGYTTNNVVESSYFNPFKGGFAGKCPVGQKWTYEYDDDAGKRVWTCSGALNFDLNFYTPDVQPANPEETTVGVFIDNQIFQNDRDQESFTRAYESQYGETANIQKVNMTCYAGTSIPSDTGKKFNKIVDVPDTLDKPLFVSGTVDLSDSSTYTCDWNFILDIKDQSGEWEVIKDVGNQNHLTGSDAEDEFGLSQYINPTPSGTGSIMYSDPEKEEGTIEDVESIYPG